MNDTLTHRTVETNGIRMHFVEAGEGPLVVLLHGFPEGWYSWRHQLPALAAAGFHAVAPDQRGYGRTDRPADIDRYSMFQLVGDVIGLISALGEKSAVVVGHDWGASVAWNTSLFRPDLVRGVAALSVPLRPRISKPPLDMYRDALGPGFYQLYFQEPGVAERELEKDVRRTMRAILCGESGDAIRFVEATEGLDFRGAVELLADRYGVELKREREDPQEEERRRRRERLLQLVERATAFYARFLWDSDEAAAAREYLAGRGLGEEVLREFRIGYSPPGWDRKSNPARSAQPPRPPRTRLGRGSPRGG